MDGGNLLSAITARKVCFCPHSGSCLVPDIAHPSMILNHVARINIIKWVYPRGRILFGVVVGFEDIT
jgi:hypothetical protein